MSTPIFTTRASLSSRPCRSIVCPTGYSRLSSASWSPAWRSCESPRRDRFVRHLAEFGLVAPRGVANVEQLWEAFASTPKRSRSWSCPRLACCLTGSKSERAARRGRQADAVDREGGRGVAAADNHSGGGRGRRDGGTRLRTGDGELPPGA